MDPFLHHVFEGIAAFIVSLHRFLFERLCLSHSTDRPSLIPDRIARLRDAYSVV